MDCLFCMEQKGWINDGNPLHGLAAQMQDEINEELVVEMVTSKSASLHAGSTPMSQVSTMARQAMYLLKRFCPLTMRMQSLQVGLQVVRLAKWGMGR